MLDEELIRGITTGNSELYGEIVMRYQEKLYRTAFYYTQNAEEASDITQEVFIKAYNSLSRFKRGSSFSTWLYRIAVNHCIDWCRKKRLHSEDIFLEDFQDERDSPEELFLRQETSLEVQEVVKSLPVIYSTILILYYFEDLSPQQIADILDISKRTVETRLFRGRKILKAKINHKLSGGERYDLLSEQGRLAQLR